MVLEMKRVTKAFEDFAQAVKKTFLEETPKLCPTCSGSSTKVIYMGLPMRLCLVQKCNTLFGLWSNILYVVPFNGWLYSYEGNYIEGLIGWWKEMDGDGDGEGGEGYQ